MTDQLREYKRRAALLAAAYELEHKRRSWLIDIDGDVKLIERDPEKTWVVRIV